MRNLILTVATFVVLNACNQPKNETQKQVVATSPTVGLVELTTFKLNKGVTSSDFTKAAEQMQNDFLAKQNGFVRRTLTNSGDTLWTDIVFWQNAESHGKAMQLAEKSETVLSFMSKIDFNSVKMALTTPVLDK